MVLTSSITLQRLGEIEQRALVAGAKITVLECLFFVCHALSSEAGALFVRRAHSLNKYCVMVYG